MGEVKYICRWDFSSFSSTINITLRDFPLFPADFIVYIIFQNLESSSAQLLKRPALLPIMPINDNQKGSSSNKKRKLDSFVDKISNTEKSVIDNQVMKFLCGCNIIFDVVESCHFKNLIKLLRPAYKLPSKDIMNTTLLDTVHQQLIKNSSNCEKSDRILMVSQRNYTADTKYIIGVLHSKNKV